MDKLSDLRLYVRLAATLSFTETARSMNVSRSSAGRTITRLEAQLGTQLIQRTTRQVALTSDGAAFRDRCLGLLADADTMAAMFSHPGSRPRGKLRVSVPSRMGRRLFAPKLSEFLDYYPDIELDLAVTDRAVDLIGEGYDCVVRVGEQRVSGLTSRTITRLTMINVAGPNYLSRRGTPRTLADLRNHEAIGYMSPLGHCHNAWEYMENNRTRKRNIKTSVRVNNAEMYIACACAGLGLIQVPAYDVQALIHQGKLLEVLPEYPSEPMPVAIVAPNRPSLTPSINAFSQWVESVCLHANQTIVER